MANFLRLIFLVFCFFSPLVNATACGLGDNCFFVDNQAQALSMCNGQRATYGSGNCSLIGINYTPDAGTTYYTHDYELGAGSWYEYAFICLTSQGTYNHETKRCDVLDCSNLTNPTSSIYVPPFVDGVPNAAGQVFTPQTYLNNAPRCIGGCTWSPQTTTGSVSTTLNGAMARFTGFYYPTGAQCGVVDLVAAKIPPPPDNSVCTTYASGQKMCVKSGKYCYTTTTGRESCWSIGETGNKTDGPVNQQTVAGPSVSIPPLPPPGETMAPTGTPATTTTTTTSSSSSSSTTTNTTNYNTYYGSNAGPSNQGQPDTSSSGSSTPSTSTSGSSAGGGSCSAPYTCTGTNGVECAQLEEQRLTRCGTTASNTILGSIVSAETANGTKLDAANSSLTAIKNSLDGTTTTTRPGDSTGTASANGLGANTDFGSSGLSDSGYGLSRTCPTIADQTILGHTVHFDTSMFCTWQQNTGLLVLLVTGLGCLWAFAKGT